MKQKRTLWIIIIIVLLNSVGMSVILPLLPFLIGKYLPAHQVVFGMSALLSVFAACTFIAAPVLGSLSDHLGRKLILMISLAGSVAGYILFGIGGSLWVLFLGRILDGLTAGNISTLFAIVSDCTTPAERVRWFGYIGSAMGVGKLGGPFLGGLLGSVHLALPFYITAGLILISGIMVYFWLPETLSTERRTSRLLLRNLNPLSHFKDMVKIRNIRFMLIPGILFFAALGIFQFNFTVYLKDIYQWGPAMIGGLLTLAGIFEITSRAVFLPGLLRYIQDGKVGFIGLGLMGAGLGLILSGIFIHSAILMALSVILIITGEGIFDPVYNGRLSRMVPEQQQGKLQGVNQSLQAANNMLIPLGAAAAYFQSPALLYSLAVTIILTALIFYSKTIPANH